MECKWVHGQERAAVQAWSQTSRSWKSSMIKNPKACKTHQHHMNASLPWKWWLCQGSTLQFWAMTAFSYRMRTSWVLFAIRSQGFLIKRGRFMPTSKGDARCLTLFAYPVPNCMEGQNMIDDSGIIKHLKTVCFWRNFTQTSEELLSRSQVLNHGQREA